MIHFKVIVIRLIRSREAHGRERWEAMEDVSAGVRPEVRPGCHNHRNRLFQNCQAVRTESMSASFIVRWLFAGCALHIM
jgi:hypothetical protein